MSMFIQIKLGFFRKEMILIVIVHCHFVLGKRLIAIIYSVSIRYIYCFLKIASITLDVIEAVSRTM